MWSRIALAFIIFINLTQGKAQTSPNDSLPLFDAHAFYIGEVTGILSGGVQRGSAYLGMAGLQLSFNPWKGGLFYIFGANTHGDEPSAKLAGDYQVASNIEAGNHTYLQEFWYLHSWKRLEAKLGIIDLNADFVNTSNGLLFLNSSFGIIPLVSSNVHAPIFPLTALGFTANWQISDKNALLLAAFDGRPTDFEGNPHNLKWHFDEGDGTLFFSEYQRHIMLGEKKGLLKAGYFLHRHTAKTVSDLGYKNNSGFYLITDQQLWENATGKKQLDFFMQFGYSSRNYNHVHCYAGGGLNFTGIITHEGNDVLGIALAHVVLRGSENETALELTWQLQATSFLLLQPDIQYIINPSGSGASLHDCLLVTMRFGINL